MMGAYGGSHDIHDGIDGTNLMEMNPVRRDTVDPSLRLC